MMTTENPIPALALVARDAIIEGNTEGAVAIANEIHESFDDALANYLAALERGYAKYCTARGYQNKERYKLSKPGKRFVRVVHDGSSHSFVELSNGYIWKCATWKAPELNYPRGNIYDHEHVEKLAERYYHGLGGASPYEKDLA